MQQYHYESNSQRRGGSEYSTNNHLNTPLRPNYPGEHNVVSSIPNSGGTVVKDMPPHKNRNSVTRNPPSNRNRNPTINHNPMTNQNENIKKNFHTNANDLMHQNPSLNYDLMSIKNPPIDYNLTSNQRDGMNQYPMPNQNRPNNHYAMPHQYHSAYNAISNSTLQTNAQNQYISQSTLTNQYEQHGIPIQHKEYPLPPNNQMNSQKNQINLNYRSLPSQHVVPVSSPQDVNAYGPSYGNQNRHVQNSLTGHKKISLKFVVLGNSGYVLHLNGFSFI